MQSCGVSPVFSDVCIGASWCTAAFQYKRWLFDPGNGLYVDVYSDVIYFVFNFFWLRVVCCR